MADDHVKDKVIIITGAGSGFGRLTSEMVAARGAAVVAADVNGDAATETVDAIVKAGGRAVAVTADVTQMADMRKVAEVAVETFGAIDVLVNNAGIMPLAFFADHAQAWEAWDRCIDINFKGVVHGINAVHDQMIEQGRGHVINISSIYGNRGSAGSGVYSATKAAVNAVSESLRVESRGKIKVTVVKPTGVPGTNLAGGVINYEATVGITGQNKDRFNQQVITWMSGMLPDDEKSIESPGYWTLAPEDLATQIVAVIDTPWGLNISDITVRATGDDYVQ